MASDGERDSIDKAGVTLEEGKAVDMGHTNYGGHGINTTEVPPGSDPAYEQKIKVMNEALIDLGMNAYQWKIFITTSFGWFVDNFWLQAITIISPLVQAEFNVDQISFIIVAKYIGLLLGSSLWPMTADFIGRKTAFNITLLISGVAGLVGAGAPTFAGIATFCAFIGLGTGGNQPVDSAIFLEYIPATHQYLLVMQSAMWSIGQAVAALIAWPLIVNFSCPEDVAEGQCHYHENLGWRYTMWTFGGLTTLMFIARFAFRLYETPKYLLGKGKNEEAARVVQKVAGRDGKETWLTASHFDVIDDRLGLHALDSSDAEMNITKNILQRNLAKFTPRRILKLFSTPRQAVSTTLMLFLWCSIGMAYPLYTGFIPFYLEQKGVDAGNSSRDITYRNYAIQAVCGIPASVIGGYSVEIKAIGRKGTGTLACILTGIFLFLYTRANSAAAVLGFSCAIAFFQNLVYGLLYAYTPELFPATIRGTGNGLVALFNRLSGLMAPIIVMYVGLDTSVPIWISAGLFVFAGLVFLILPYESRGKAAA